MIDDNFLWFYCLSTELYLFLMCLVCIIYCVVFDKAASAKKLKMPLVFVLLCSLFFLFFTVPEGSAEAFNGLFLSSREMEPVKLILILSTILLILVVIDKDTKDYGSLNSFEFPIMILFSLIGMLTLVSANDFISLYLSMELMSLSMYVLAAFNRENKLSSEAGLKYFILGAMSSGIMLYGISLIYGFTGSLNFSSLQELFSLSGGAGATSAIQVGVVLILVGFLFKLSAAPFHYWTPDVYEGSSTPVTAFFAIVPKIASFAALYNILSGPFAYLPNIWSPVLLIAAGCSFVVGSVGGLLQKKLKRLLAYSAINNVGFVLLALSTGHIEAFQTILFYFIIYMVTLVGVFAFVLKMVSHSRATDDINSLAGVAKTNPWFGLMFAFLMFSLAGIPPFWGFYGKLYIIKLALANNFLIMSFIAVVTSAVSAFYYIKIVKVMYFDEISTKTIIPMRVSSVSTIVGSLASIISLFGLLFISTIMGYLY